MHAFFGRPTRGGVLTIVNCLLWGVVAIGIATDTEVLLLAALVAWWPVAWVFFLPVLGHSSAGEVVPMIIAHSPSQLILPWVMIGVNCFFWGYGISWLLRVKERRERREYLERWRQSRLPKGFEVIVPTAKSPEDDGGAA